MSDHDDIKRRAEKVLKRSGAQIPGKWNVGFLNAAKDDLPAFARVVLAAAKWREYHVDIGNTNALDQVRAILAGKGPYDD